MRPSWKLMILIVLALALPCHAQQPTPILPDPKLTPGATLPVTMDDLKVPGYTRKVRNVPQVVKEKVYLEYGITSHGRGDYEVDHLISLELGGSNSIKNLWPESYRTQPWNARVKDKLENKLHALVCSGKVDLPTAQREIATDWVAAYKKYMGSDLPFSHARSVQGRPRYAQTHGHKAIVPRSFPHADTTKVWVNTRSGVYHFPGERWYGNTAEGEYMSEADAKKAGYRPTENGQ